MAHPDARADGRLDAVLMEGDDKRRGQLVRFPFLNADGRINAAQDMRLDGHRPVLCSTWGRTTTPGCALFLFWAAKISSTS